MKMNLKISAMKGSRGTLWLSVFFYLIPMVYIETSNGSQDSPVEEELIIVGSRVTEEEATLPVVDEETTVTSTPKPSNIVRTNLIPSFGDDKLNVAPGWAISIGSDKKVIHAQRGRVLETDDCERELAWKVALDLPYDTEFKNVYLADFDQLATKTNATFNFHTRGVRKSEDPETCEPSSWIVGSEIEVGMDSIDYVLKSNLVDAQEKNVQPWSVHAFVENVRERSVDESGLGLVGIGLKHQSYYEPIQDSLICESDESSVLSICRTVSIGQPSQKSRNLAYVDAYIRIYAFRLVPRITIDLDEESFGIVIPIYHQGDAVSEDKFKSGFAIGWRSDRKELVSSFTVGRKL